MRNNTIKFIIALATVSIVGIIVTQVYWVGKAFDIKEKQFNQTAHIALRSVADKIAKLNQSVLNPNPVKQITSDYFVVNVNDAIDSKILEYYLKTEFDKYHLTMDFEYGIYDCSSDKMVYGNYVSYNESEIAQLDTMLPKSTDYSYYFGVRFPTRTTYLASEMDIWMFSSFILMTVIVFFGYTLFIILKQKRLSEIQRDFINNMTHEFKTPISTIAISADLITNPKILAKPESLLNYANIIKTQNTRLKDQIEKVLQMAVMDRGRLKLSKEIINIHQLICDSVNNFNLKAQAEIEILTDLVEENQCVLADKVHLTNIIYNLLDNATKYVKVSPIIKISTKLNKNQIILSIQDNGIGISKSHQRKVFDKFFRVPTGNIHDVKGFGLGLNYVKLIVKAHNWKIDLRSELEKGSTFDITMPICKQEKLTVNRAVKSENAQMSH